MSIDHDALARDLVRMLRGRRSQVQLSRWLGFSTNTVYSWEAGRRWPTASRFLFVAERVGHAPGEVLADFLGTAEPLATDRPGVAAFLQRCRGDLAVATIAERTGRSRYAVSRWLRGQSEPRLPDFLRLIEATTLRLLDFVAQLCDPAELSSAAREWATLQRARDTAWAAPWTQGVLLALTLPGYRSARHDPDVLVAALGLAREEIDRCLDHLRATGQVRWDGHRWRPVAVPTVDLRRPGSGTALKQHWLEVAAARLEQPADGALFSYNLFTIDGASFEELRRMQRAYYRSVRSLVADAPAGDRVVLMGVQLVPLAGAPAGDPVGQPAKLM